MQESSTRRPQQKTCQHNGFARIFDSWFAICLVYVGGAMAGAYATDPAATEPRTTIDVDCVVNSTSYSEHAAFEELLRQKHFQNDQTPDAPICRWIYNGEKVNVMSMDEKSQSFGNRWYRPGFGKRERFVLESGRSIYRLPATYYIATKIEALLYISEELECALPSDEIERADMILELMRQMATYTPMLPSPADLTACQNSRQSPLSMTPPPLRSIPA